MRRVYQYLRPPHIIELLLSSWYPSEWKLNRPAFLRQLGLFDTWDGIILDNSRSRRTAYVFDVNIVDGDVGRSLRQMENSEATEKRSHVFRVFRWPFYARARLLFRDETVQEIIDNITNSE